MAAKERKALGTGLSVLFGGDDIDDEGSELITVPVSKIEPRTEQPRERFDEDALKTLADSISRYGLIQPITVRKTESEYYQIIAGERRWRASKLAGLSEVPVRVIEADDRTTAELALVENLQREDLNPVEEAKGYRSLIDEFGLTQEEIALSIGKSRPAVANSLRLLSLCPEVIGLVEKGDLSAGHARTLVPIEDSAAQLQAAKEVISKNYSVRRTESFVSSLLKAYNEVIEEPESHASTGITVDYGREISDELSKYFGRRVNLIEGRNSGKIEFEYYGSDDREKLISDLKRIIL